MPIENIKSYLEEAKKMTQKPDAETDIVNLELEMETIGFIRGLAAAWNCSENDIIVASLMAICNEKPQKLSKMAKSSEKSL